MGQEVNTNMQRLWKTLMNLSSKAKVAIQRLGKKQDKLMALGGKINKTTKTAFGHSCPKNLSICASHRELLIS
jgi:hypothetical protein